jgi:hypothetical protein
MCCDQPLMAAFTLVTRQTFEKDFRNMSAALPSQPPIVVPWKLIYYEAYIEQSDALGREKYLKSGAGRRFLKSQLRNYLEKYPLRRTA